MFYNIRKKRNPQVNDMQRTILHSDCNSFYASVESLYHPEYRGQPLAVGGDEQERRGIILAKNPLAAQCGVKTGEALWQAKKKCPALVILHPDFELYSRFSKMTREIYLEYTDLVEPFGLDEAWLDVSESRLLKGDGVNIANELRERIKCELGITVSIGVSFNKIYAKLGSDYKKPDAVTVINRDNYKEIVYPLPVSDLLFVGKHTKERLVGMGINTIGELAESSEKLMTMVFGKNGPVLRKYAAGEDDSPVERYGNCAPVKSVGNSTTAHRDLTSNKDAKIIFMNLAESVSARMKAQGLYGRVITIGIRDNRLHWISKQRVLPNSTNNCFEIAREAMMLFEKNYDWRLPLRGLSISMSELDDASAPEQMGIFPVYTNHEREEKLDSALLDIKRRFGKASVQPALMLTDKELAGIEMRGKSDGGSK